MGRKPREHVPGAFYHIITRGNCRGAIFLEDRDRLRFLLLLERFSRLLEIEVHGYCLMTNHVHLILQMFNHTVSELAHRLFGQYSRWFNRENGRNGHLFEKRHRSIRIESDRQLLAVLRYVHSNPVRANLVQDAGDFRWSSHLVYLGPESSPWITTSTCLELLGSDRETCRRRYLELIGAPDVEACSEGLPPLGSSRIVDRNETEAIESRWHRTKSPGGPDCEVERILRAVERVTQVALHTMEGRDRHSAATKARALAAYIVNGQRSTTLSDLASQLCRDVSTLSRAASAIRRQIEQDPRLAETLEAVECEMRSS